VLLKAEDLGDFFSRFSLLRQIVAADVDLFQQIRAERDKLAAQRVKLEQEKQQLAVLRNEAQAKRDAVQQEKNSQQQMMARIQSDKKMHERAIAELEELSEELIGIIQRLQLAQEGKLSTVNKDFTWPTAGPITSYFGRRFHPVLKVWKGHTGIDIGAPHGQQIKAAESGIVIFSGWLGGYGQAIIIDHGGGYSTLYAHASRLLASVNTTVVKGQHIANIGSTGLSTGPHLHFEIRVNGTPVNPLGMLP
jgi:murein DD-endopeptidase MepM/ murein hydrolase activator NlpD